MYPYSEFLWKRYSLDDVLEDKKAQKWLYNLSPSIKKIQPFSFLLNRIERRIINLKVWDNTAEGHFLYQIVYVSSELFPSWKNKTSNFRHNFGLCDFSIPLKSADSYTDFAWEDVFINFEETSSRKKKNKKKTGNKIFSNIV